MIISRNGDMNCKFSLKKKIVMPHTKLTEIQVLAFLTLPFLHFLNTVTYLLAQMVKNLPAMQEIQVQSLGKEDPLEKEMATHCNILA